MAKSDLKPKSKIRGTVMGAIEKKSNAKGYNGASVTFYLHYEGEEAPARHVVLLTAAECPEGWLSPGSLGIHPLRVAAERKLNETLGFAHKQEVPSVENASVKSK